MDISVDVHRLYLCQRRLCRHRARAKFLERAKSRGGEAFSNWKPADGLIIHIQDVHQNKEAQQNISRAIQFLASSIPSSPSNPSMLVALEGAFAPIDISRFRAFEDQNAVHKVADYLIRENKI